MVFAFKQEEAEMQVEDIGITQVIVVLIFLGGLILLQQLIKKNKLGIQGHFNQKRRIILIDDLGLSNTERVRIIRVDGYEYIQFTNKGCSPTVIPHKAKIETDLKRTKPMNSTVDTFNSKFDKVAINKKQPNVLSDAITNARKMNPKLGFKK